MQANTLTHWGTYVLYIRGMCAGLLLSSILFPDSSSRGLYVGTGGFVACVLVTPLLRVLGWRVLIERTEDAPVSEDVERKLRTLLDAGMTLPDAIHHHFQTQGGMMDLCSAVASVSNQTPTEALRTVILATTGRQRV